MNGDLISREVTLNALKERYCEGCTYYGVRCKSVLAANCPIYNAIISVGAVPAVDAEPVRRGKWVYHDDDMMPYKSCSLCGCEVFDLNGANYCPYCGAKMDADNRTQITS